MERCLENDVREFVRLDVDGRIEYIKALVKDGESDGYIWMLRRAVIALESEEEV